MKKTLLTLGAVAGFAAGAFAQGAINVQTPSVAGFNTASSNPNDATFSDFPSGTVTLEIFAATSTGDTSLASQAAAINSDDSSSSTVLAGVALLESDFTLLPAGTSVGSETSANSFAITDNGITTPTTLDVGTSSTLTSGTIGEYGILATYVSGGKTYTGALVLNADGPLQMGGGSDPAYQAQVDWPNQNLLLAPVPEPTTLALAGLGGLSMLFLRRRKS